MTMNVELQMGKAGINSISILAPLHKPPLNYDLVVISSLRLMKVREMPWEERRERKMRSWKWGVGVGGG